MTKEKLRQEFTSKTGDQSVVFVHGHALSPTYTVWLEQEVLELRIRNEYLNTHISELNHSPIIDDDM